MKLISRPLINHAFNYVIQTCKLYNIDESHALKHSMDVFDFSNRIYDCEIITNPILKTQQNIIHAAAIGHDMCDKKYMDECEGVKQYSKYLDTYLEPVELDIVEKIITTMSYSKVKVNGYPDLGEYQTAYNIVREADLLSAYDFNRCIIYKMYRNNWSYMDALSEALELFEIRVFKMITDELFTTSYAKKESLILHEKAKNEIDYIKQIFY